MSALQRLPARKTILGVDTPILRALPHRERRMVGAWCFLDHLGPTQFAPGDGMHVGAHPHIGLQTFTWMIEGEVLHRDSLGNEQVIRPGQVNLMTAGHGISHTEDSAAEGARMHAAQLWIALPDAERERAPAFQNHPVLPVRTLGDWQVTVLAGSALGATSPAQVFTPLVGLELLAPAAGEVRLPLDPGFEHAAMVLEGEAWVDGERLDADELLYLPPGADGVELRSRGPLRLLWLGGQPWADTPILLWWNFVGRDQAGLEAALADWNGDSGRFGTVRPGSPAPRLLAPALAGVHLKT
ncbi:pirin family protein [Ideonella dechloratans]|uniref:pirin family protein n=1 Tax=Ideonella dechloratans TaxID=36863 RepID=UPI0035B15E57